MNRNAKWIKPAADMGDAAPTFSKTFHVQGTIEKATLLITALGVYDAYLNGSRVGKFILAPGWTMYHKRLQYQEYDVTSLLSSENHLEVTVGKGWYHGRIPARFAPEYKNPLLESPCGIIAQLEIVYAGGRTETIYSDESWQFRESQVRFSDIYDGEITDATFRPDYEGKVRIFEGPYETLIPQQGEEIREQELITAARIFQTPKGETILDFGQNLTGYVVTTVTAASGEVIDLSFAEVLDTDGNFYTENYRSSKSRYHYICTDGMQTYKPRFTFWGFRYVRINAFPGGIEKACTDNFTAIVVHSDMKRTGYLSCSDPLLNRLFHNIIWGQKDNFLDVPTDCPQRDERLGWTGDAQVFIRTACLNYDCEKFFTKWLADMSAEQHEDGCVGHIIPGSANSHNASAAWGDAAAICPWEIYMAYGNPAILEQQFESMCKWVDYITLHTTTPGLWTGGTHFGDWLGLDAPSGSYKGSSRDDFIASAFYARSTELVINAGKVLGKDVTTYEELYANIIHAFRETFPVYTTQTECTLAVHFRLADDLQKAADQLANMVEEAGVQLRTGFVGTPYLLHALSDYGHADLAYSLLLRREYPSWLYPVTKDATTIWEHWDGIMENGDFWSPDMNSFNHYAYGAVADWVYSNAAGIKPMEEAPGYAKAVIAPIPDARLDWLKATLETRHGLICSEWRRQGDLWRYDIITPVESDVIIAGRTHHVDAGKYCFYAKLT
ncbi:MAG: alfa-L-rhamnosidase [Lachnospiraceae bacterium]|nr:alfa-L-rhamnosidase [Lachnospiraceae bacterium]